MHVLNALLNSSSSLPGTITQPITILLREQLALNRLEVLPCFVLSQPELSVLSFYFYLSVSASIFLSFCICAPRPLLFFLNAPSFSKSFIFILLYISIHEYVCTYGIKMLPRGGMLGNSFSRLFLDATFLRRRMWIMAFQFHLGINYQSSPCHYQSSSIINHPLLITHSQLCRSVVTQWSLIKIALIILR